MSTSDFNRTLTAAAVGGGYLALIASPLDPAMSSLSIHPIWALALILAARYGSRALVSLPLFTSTLLIAEWIAGGSGAAMIARTQRGGDLVAWVLIVVVGLVGEAHQRRKALLGERLDAVEAHARQAEQAIDKLSNAALALRDRCNRSETSLVFLADVAARMEDPNPSDAGLAALELAMARTGAGAALVQLLDSSGRLRTVSSRGTWSAETFRPPALFRDLTAVAAVARRTAVAAHEVTDVRADDSDLAAPLFAPNGRVIGVLALRRLPQLRLASAVREDLLAVARWVALPLARARVNADVDPGTASEAAAEPVDIEATRATT